MLEIPVIGSLNGISPGGWIKYAQQIEQAGADALELNCYYLPTDITVSSSELENAYVKLVKEAVIARVEHQTPLPPHVQKWQARSDAYQARIKLCWKQRGSSLMRSLAIACSRRCRN